jgi:hypothetical protein
VACHDGGVPLLGTDKATGRVIALIALLVLTGIALRGYLPPEERSAEDQPTSSPAALIGVITMLLAAVVIITIAIIATMRQPRGPRQGAGPIAHTPIGRRPRPSLRLLIIAVAVILVWLLAVVLLMRLTAGLDFGDQSMPTTPSTATSTATPDSAAPPDPQAPPDDQGDVFWLLFGVTLFMLALWVAGVVLAFRRKRPLATAAPGTDDVEFALEPPGPQPLAVAAERGLAAMGDLRREPREAIIACYAAMEDALANAPRVVPQDSDTPSEVLARAVEHHALHAGSANELVDLFAEARFSPHVMNEEHREIAVRALQLVLAELRSAV